MHAHMVLSLAALHISALNWPIEISNYHDKSSHTFTNLEIHNNVVLGDSPGKLEEIFKSTFKLKYKSTASYISQHSRAPPQPYYITQQLFHMEWMVFFMMVVASISCSLVMMRGGAILIISPRMGLASTPLSLSFRHMFHALISADKEMAIWIIALWLAFGVDKAQLRWTHYTTMT